MLRGQLRQTCASTIGIKALQHQGPERRIRFRLPAKQRKFEEGRVCRETSDMSDRYGIFLVAHKAVCALCQCEHVKPKKIEMQRHVIQDFADASGIVTANLCIDNRNKGVTASMRPKTVSMPRKGRVPRKMYLLQGVRSTVFEFLRIGCTKLSFLKKQSQKKV